MAAPPLLHVVYCGRGDAMLLEYTENATRRLVLIDGGPMTAKPPSSQPMPYWKYYISAARRVWDAMHAPGPVPPFQPDAIINSHADEDHYGGLIRLLQTSLVGPLPPSMVFHGPYQMPSIMKKKKPNPPYRGGVILPRARPKELNTAWKAIQSILVQSRGFIEGRGFKVPGLERDYPIENEIAFFADNTIAAPKPVAARPRTTE